MSKFTFSCILVLVLALFCSCQGIKRPERPVTTMFPTVLPANVMSALAPCSLSHDDLQEIMDKTGTSPELQKAGFLQTDYSIIRRGLEKRGYAEIDGRRCRALPWQWLTFCAISGNDSINLCISKGYNTMPANISLPDLARPPRFRRPAANGYYQDVEVIQEYDNTKILRVFQPDSPGKLSHWEIIYTFPIKKTEVNEENQPDN